MGTGPHRRHRHPQRADRCAHLLSFMENIQHLNKKGKQNYSFLTTGKVSFVFRCGGNWGKHRREICEASAHLQQVVKINNPRPQSCPHLETFVSTALALRKRRRLSHTDYRKPAPSESSIPADRKRQGIEMKQGPFCSKINTDTLSASGGLRLQRP